MANNIPRVGFMLTSPSSLDDKVKLLEDAGVKVLRPFGSNILRFFPELDEKYEIIFKMQEKIENLFPLDIPYSLDYEVSDERNLNLKAKEDQEIISLFGHSDHEKVNNYKLTTYYKMTDNKRHGFIVNPEDKFLNKLSLRYGRLLWFFAPVYNVDGDLKQGMYMRFIMKFSDFESIPQEDIESISNAIKSLKQTHYIEKIHRGFKIVVYIEDPSYEHILNKEIAENRFYKYDDIIRPQILKFGHDLIESIKNKINCGYKLTFATTTPGSFETMAGGVIIVKNNSDRPYIDICCCPKNNLSIDETVMDYETGRFEEYYHKVLRE